MLEEAVAAAFTLNPAFDIAAMIAETIAAGAFTEITMENDNG
jgi:hypothetical protein